MGEVLRYAQDDSVDVWEMVKKVLRRHLGASRLNVSAQDDGLMYNSREDAYGVGPYRMTATKIIQREMTNSAASLGDLRSESCVLP